MSTRQGKGLRAIGVFLTFAIAQVYLQFGFAAPISSSRATALPQQFIARLATLGGPVTVNGVSTSNGASLFTGASIQTSPAVSATIDLAQLGSLSLAPNSNVRLDFDENERTVKVTVLSGCFSLATTKGTHGQVDTAQQEKAAETNRAAGGILSGCMGPTGFTQGSGAGAVAGGGAGSGSALGAGATAASIGIATAIPAIVYFTHRPGNPSNSAP